MALPGLYDCFQHWGEKNAVWVISDTHFGDKDIKKAFPNRPSDEELIKNINQKVGKTGTLLLLGDVGDIECAKQLKGYKVLIAGNHDIGATNYQRQKWIKRFDKDKFQKDEAIVEMKHLYPGCSYTIFEGYDFHAPFEYWEIEADNKLFDMVFSGPVMLGEKLILSHEPIDVPWAFNLHGHDHAGAKRNGHLNVCADVIGYTPINLNQFLKSGALSKIKTTRRTVIDKATERKKKRGGRKIGEK